MMELHIALTEMMRPLPSVKVMSSYMQLIHHALSACYKLLGICGYDQLKCLLESTIRLSHACYVTFLPLGNYNTCMHDNYNNIVIRYIYIPTFKWFIYQSILSRTAE